MKKIFGILVGLAFVISLAVSTSALASYTKEEAEAHYRAAIRALATEVNPSTERLRDLIEKHERARKCVILLPLVDGLDIVLLVLQEEVMDTSARTSTFDANTKEGMIYLGKGLTCDLEGPPEFVAVDDVCVVGEGEVSVRVTSFVVRVGRQYDYSFTWQVLGGKPDMRIRVLIGDADRQRIAYESVFGTPSSDVLSYALTSIEPEYVSGVVEIFDGTDISWCRWDGSSLFRSF
jgi:hypothetical protein